MKSKKRRDLLEGLVQVASPDVLRELIRQLSSERLEVRRECLTFLKERVALSSGEDESAEAEALMSLWYEAEPDLSELDDYGGGDYDLVDHVGELLYELAKGLEQKKIHREYRRELLDEVISYIRSGNAGMDDELYDVTYAACYDSEDLRDLAKRFETTGREWPIDHARRIYRDIGDHQKYLELRSHRMKYGSDYHDLATFYWETGERNKAIEVAIKGLKEAEGRMDELRTFMIERAQESEDRPGYLELKFEEAVDGLTLEKYRAFKKVCTKEEWDDFEPRMLASLGSAWDGDRMRIHMFRKEYDKALSILKTNRYPDRAYDDGGILKVAEDLESVYPEEILSFYIAGLGNLNGSFDRKIYARKARVMAKVRHVWVDLLEKPEKWKEFGSRVKHMNLRRSAFQEEFARALSDWKNL